MSKEQELLNEISVKRKKYTDAVRENEFEEGILSLLSELYPDEAHFVFELLQNAEDAEATNVVFELMPESLRVTHDGKRLFNRKDIEGITSIAKSPKKDDVNKIGKFGIGFKAVFSYTKTPRVFSGGVDFEIRDLVCPHPIEPINKKTHETVFIFPFNNPDKVPKDCIQEIKSVFKKADETFILFLNNIRTIHWKVGPGSSGQGSIAREDLDQNLIRIVQKNGENCQEALFLKYQKSIPGHGQLNCNVAFQLEDKKKQQKIIQTNGKLCIFFPAEKENTGLRFHINGPYASSIDRASIKHQDKGNKEILRITSELVVESLSDIKQRGLLGLDVLEILPNDDDPLADFFSEIRTYLITCLKTDALVPSRDGGFYPAKDLVYGPKLLTDCISDEQMGFLSGKEGRFWAIGALRNSRAHKLLSSLNIPTWDEDTLINLLDRHFGKARYWPQPDNKLEMYKWLNKQDDQWLVDFYLLIRRVLKGKDAESKAKNWRIIRCSDCHHFGNEVFFDTEENASGCALPIVKHTLFMGLNHDKKKRLLEFLNWAGVREIGEKQVIEGILDKHYPIDSSEVVVAKTTHIRHMRRFVKWYREHRDISLFEDRNIFRSNDPQDEACYECTNNFIDDPFQRTNLSYIYENELSPLYESKWAIWHEYKQIKGFIDFAIALGAEEKLAIVRISLNHRLATDRYSGGLLERWYERWNSNKIIDDYTIEDLAKLLEKPDVKISHLIWLTLCKAEDKFLKARFRPNLSWPTKLAPSTLILELKNRPWVPTKDGSFKKPCDVNDKQLAKGFSLDDTTGWLAAIGFGEKEKQESQKEKEKLATIKTLGLNKKAYELALKLADMPDFIDQFEEIVERAARKPKFPERPSPNPDRRTDKAGESVTEAQDKKYGKKMASTRTSSASIDKREYLVEKYTNDNQLFCQICKDVMPFKLPSGEYYFEAVEAIKTGEKEHASNFLALCPLCAAKYKEWVKKVPNATELLCERILEQKDFDIPIDMDHKHYTIKFVEQHFIDFREYVKNATPG
jgi:hypothetical protein